MDNKLNFEKDLFFEVLKECLIDQLEDELRIKNSSNKFFQEGNKFYHNDVLDVMFNNELYNKTVIIGYIFNLLDFIQYREYPDELKMIISLEKEKYKYIIGEMIINCFYGEKIDNENIQSFINRIIKKLLKEKYKYI
jgi:hypothetical protein